MERERRTRKSLGVGFGKLRCCHCGVVEGLRAERCVCVCGLVLEIELELGRCDAMKRRGGWLVRYVNRGQIPLRDLRTAPGSWHYQVVQQQYEARNHQV
jgi:hypothetical protein